MAYEFDLHELKSSCWTVCMSSSPLNVTSVRGCVRSRADILLKLYSYL